MSSREKLQIRVHRTWSTDHNRNQPIKNWSILKSWVFSMNLVQHLYTLLGRHLLPLRLSHSLCSYVGELAPDIKSPCPSISSVCQPSMFRRMWWRCPPVNQVFSRRPRTALGAGARWWIWITSYVWIEENASHVSPLCHKVRLHCSDGLLPQNTNSYFPKVFQHQGLSCPSLLAYSTSWNSQRSHAIPLWARNSGLLSHSILKRVLSKTQPNAKWSALNYLHSTSQHSALQDSLSLPQLSPSLFGSYPPAIQIVLRGIQNSELPSKHKCPTCSWMRVA